MARLGAIGTGGNFTTAGTWGVINTNNPIDSEASTLTISTAPSTHSSTIVTTSVVVTDGVYLKVFSKTSTGTFTVTLRNFTTSTDITSVTVNVSDLPAKGWCFFKWSATQTTLVTDTYHIRVSCSSASSVTLYRSLASAQEFTRLLRTTTTASPGAGDQMIICEELTGQGTNNGTCTVTMNNTASTVFGATTYSDSLGVGHNGVLTWGTSTSTNYLLTIAGLVSVWDGGTWNRGTSDTRIPSTSTAVLKFSVTTNVDSGFRTIDNVDTAVVNDYGNIITSTSTLMTVSRGGYVTTVGTAVTRVSGQSFTGLTGSIVINGVTYTISSVTNSSLLVLTGSAGTQSSPVAFTHAGTATTLTVASTAGWAVGDTLAVASTSLTASDCEQVTISSVDSATQVTLSSALTKQHSGDSPTQAEVVHLIRNVRTEGTSTSLQGYVVYGNTSVVNNSYCSFQYLGSNTTSKRGISLTTTTGSYTAVGCIIKDGVFANSCGWFISGASSNNISITYCNTYNIASAPLSIAATSGTNITINYFISILNTNTGIAISDVGGTYTNITNVGCGSALGMTISEAAEITGTFSNLTVHSCSNSGITITAVTSGTVSNLNIWRNSINGLSFTANSIFTINGLTAFANANNNIDFPAAAAGSEIVFIDAVLSGDSVFSSTRGFSVHGSCTFYNSTFGVVSGIKRAHSSADLTGTFSHSLTRILLVNCVLASSTEVSNQTVLSPNSFIYSQNHDQAGGVKRWGKYGTSSLDTTTYRTASPSQTLTPNNASGKLISDDTQPIAIDNGQTATVTVYVYKSAAYNGNQPRLIVRRNDAIGITADTVLATCVGGTGSWIALSGTTAVASADGAFVCYVDCDGTAGTVSVDDWSVA